MCRLVFLAVAVVSSPTLVPSTVGIVGMNWIINKKERPYQIIVGTDNDKNKYCAAVTMYGRNPQRKAWNKKSIMVVLCFVSYRIFLFYGRINRGILRHCCLYLFLYLFLFYSWVFFLSPILLFSMKVDQKFKLFDKNGVILIG